MGVKQLANKHVDVYNQKGFSSCHNTVNYAHLAIRRILFIRRILPSLCKGSFIKRMCNK